MKEPPSRPSKSPLFYIVVAIVVLLCIELTGFLPNFFDTVEHWHFTERQKQYVSARHQSGIQIVAIDDETMASPQIRAAFDKWPYRRNLYAYLVRYFDRAQAKVLNFDIGFTGGADLVFPEKDQAFADSIRKASIPVYSSLFTKLTQDWPDPDQLLPPSVKREQLRLTGSTDEHGDLDIGYVTQDWINPPIEVLLETGMHFFPVQTLRVDKSGTIRRTIPFITFDRYVLPSMPLAQFLHGKKDIEILPDRSLRIKNGPTIDTRNNVYPYIRWYGDAREKQGGKIKGGIILHSMSIDRNGNLGPISSLVAPYFRNPKLERPSIYPIHSVKDIIFTEWTLECRDNPALDICQQIPEDFTAIAPKHFKDMYVMVGITAESTAPDVHKTIYGMDNYPGVLIQANVLDNYLHNDFVGKTPDWVTWLTVLVIGGGIGWVCLRRPVIFGVVFTIAMAGAYTTLTSWGYNEWALWINWTYPMLTLIATFTGAYIYRYLSSEKRKQQLRFAFGKYVSSGVMQQIEKNPETVSLGGERKMLTMLFSDIRGFTSFSEANDAEMVQSFLSDYFSVMNGIILHDYQGSINKLIGDAIMAYWGFPLENTDQAFLAVSASLKMKEAMEKWNEEGDKPPVYIGVGINTGEAVIGNVGSEDFMDFTVIGDSVNTAARLESATKEHAVTIIISESTHERVKDRIDARSLGSINVKGKEEPIHIFEPLGFKTSTES